MRFLKTLVLVAMAMLLAGCLGRSTRPAPFPSPTPRPPTAVAPTPIGTPTFSTPTTPIGLHSEQRCPSSLNIPLSELGLNPTFHLVVTSVSELGRKEWRLLSTRLVVDPLSIPVDASQPFSYRGSSTDQQRYVFYSADPSNASVDLWSASFGGNASIIAADDLDTAKSLEWVNRETLILFDGRKEQTWPVTWQRINHFTGEKEELDQIIIDLNIHAFSPDASQLIYLSLSDETSAHIASREWRIHDFRTHEDRTVLTSIDASQIRLPNNAKIQWTTSGVSVALMDSLSLSIAVNIDPNSLNSPDLHTEKLTFLERSTAWRIQWWSSDGRLISFRRFLEESSANTKELHKFFILNTTDWVLYDYCLPSNMIPGIIYASLDERYLAWKAIAESEEGTVVLDISTGLRSWVPAWEVLGWAIAASQ